jgi:hypothetical protein
VGRSRTGRRADAAGGVGLEARCSFCDKETRQGMLRVATRLMGRLAGKFGQGARIGDECLDLCREILAGTWS